MTAAAPLWRDEQTPRARGHLALVPSPAPAAARSVRRPARPAPMRLTRRGRVVLTLSAVLAVVVAVFLAVQAFASPAPAPTVTVEPGMTLSQIAAVHMADLPVAEAVVELRLANGLSSTDLVPGQTLTVPR